MNKKTILFTLKSIPLALIFTYLLVVVSHADQPPLIPGQPIQGLSSRPGSRPMRIDSMRSQFLQIDSQRSRLLVTHSQHGSFDIFNLTDGTLVKQCPIGETEDVVVDATHGKYYITGSRANKKLIVIDSNTFEVTGVTPLPSDAEPLTFDPKHGLAYIGHDDTGEDWVVDVASSKVVATIPIANPIKYHKPDTLVCDPKIDRVFVNDQFGVVVAIDTVSNTVAAKWPTAPARSPKGMAIDLPTHRLFVGCAGKLIEMDATSGKVISTADTASNVVQIAYDPGLKRVYCASHDGIMSVIQVKEDGLTSLGNVATQKGAHSVAVDLKTHDVWTAYVSDDGKDFFLKLTVPK